MYLVIHALVYKNKFSSLFAHVIKEYHTLKLHGVEIIARALAIIIIRSIKENVKVIVFISKF